MIEASLLLQLTTSRLLPPSLGTASSATDGGYDVEPLRHVAQRISVAVGIGSTLRQSLWR